MAVSFSYPHPVLGNSDDVSVGRIDPEVTFAVADEIVEIHVKNLVTGNHVLDQMVADRRASWLVRVECARTYLRHDITTFDETRDIRFDGHDIYGRVDLGVMLVAARTTSGYLPAGAHPDYGTATFELASGEVLGIGPSFSFDVDKQFDPLRAPIASIMRISRGEHSTGPFRLAFDDERIDILLSHEDWGHFEGVKRVPGVLHVALVLPALAEALRRMPEFAGRRWADRLRSIADAREVDPDDFVAAAQQLLENPLTRAFSEINVAIDQGKLVISQRIMRDASMVFLRHRVKEDAGVLEVYASASSFSEVADADLLNTTISVPDAPPALATSTGGPRARAANDAANAILVYGYLGSLSRTQAADPRLWVTLAHTTFWNYVRARWGESDAEKLRTAILRHWFVPEVGKAALRTQAISRLWWAAHLTCAPWERDPELSVFETVDRFRFTRILLRKQQIYFDLVERNYGSDLRLRTCILDALDQHMPSVGWSDELSRQASKQFNLLVKHRQITSLDVGSMRETCTEVVARVAAAIGSERTTEVGESDDGIEAEANDGSSWPVNPTS